MAVLRVRTWPRCLRVRPSAEDTPIAPTSRNFPIGTVRSRIDAETLATIVLLSAVLVIGLATVGDYGITVDEFNADDDGRKALAWYTSGLTDRSSFETSEDKIL